MYKATSFRSNNLKAKEFTLETKIIETALKL